MVGKKMQTEMEELKSQIKPDKSSSPGQDRQGLRVIVVDPQLRVRQNWIEHLDASATLSIVDEAGDLLPAMLNVHDLQPDILIINASLLASHPNDIAIVHTIRYLCPRTKIALIVKDRRERDYASSLGVDDALPASLDLDKISGLLEGLSKDHRRMGKFLRQQLDELPPGPHHAYQFENLLKEILQFVLSPDFTPAPRITNLWLHASPVSQLTFYYQQKREISFWRDLQRASGFNQIVVQLQNSHYILEGSLSSLSLHLNSARRSFGLVISRNPPRQSLFQEQSVLNVNGKIVLVLWDEHIKILLSLVAAGVKTDFFFRDMLVKLQQGGKPNMTDITPVRGRM